jgi:hypothetical protein
MHATSPDDQQPAVRTIGIRELQTQTDEIVREVSETSRSVEIVLGGRVIAGTPPMELDEAACELAPPLSDEERAEQRRLAMREWLRETERLAQKIGNMWPEGVSAVDAVREQPRKL